MFILALSIFHPFSNNNKDPPIGVTGVRCGKPSGRYGTKKVPEQASRHRLQRSIRFDQNRPLSVDLGSPSFFRTVSGSTHGSSSLYNIRRQRLQREQRNRQVDLRRKIEGSPLTYAYRTLPTTVALSDLTDLTDLTDQTDLNDLIAECSSLVEEQEEQHRFPVLTGAISNWPFSFIATTTDDSAALQRTMTNVDDRTHNTTMATDLMTFWSAASECSPVVMVGARWSTESFHRQRMLRREQRNRQVDCQRYLSDGSPSQHHRPTGPIQHADATPSRRWQRFVSPTRTTDPTGADSGVGLDSASSRTLASLVTETVTCPPVQKGSPSIPVFLCALIAAGLLAQVFFWLYLPHGYQRHFGGEPSDPARWCDTLDPVKQTK